MAEIYPFKGYRYNSEKVDVNDVVSQPYDKIDEELQEDYYNRSPYNIVRIILGKTENRYSRAAEDFANWKKKGVLCRDEQPSFYAYWQEYEVEGKKHVRKGFVGLGKLEAGEKVKAHENTMEGPKADRLRLLRATEANFGHIFMLYSDPERKVIKLLEKKIETEEPLCEVNDEDGNVHKLWKIDDKEARGLIQEQMKGKNLYIADGHHRYQTALNFKKECEKKGWSPGANGGFDKRLMTFINIDDPGLKILATHRLVYGVGGFRPDEFLEEIKKDFTVEKFKVKEEMYNKLDAAEGKKNVFGFKIKGREEYYTLTREEKTKNLVPDYSRKWQNLDVTILHKLILEKYLGIDEEALEQKKNLDYVRYRDRALDQLEEGDYQAGFILNPTGIEEVIELADRGEKMPQKSTDFYPKLLTGLVSHELDIGK
ncbi:MAG: DUF1015 domain-containing protein [Halanaerobiales bacterium]